MSMLLSTKGDLMAFFKIQIPESMAYESCRQIAKARKAVTE
jgi:hypothetical protein